MERSRSYRYHIWNSPIFNHPSFRCKSITIYDDATKTSVCSLCFLDAYDSVNRETVTRFKPSVAHGWLSIQKKWTSRLLPHDGRDAVTLDLSVRLGARTLPKWSTVIVRSQIWNVLSISRVYVLGHRSPFRSAFVSNSDACASIYFRTLCFSSLSTNPQQHDLSWYPIEQPMQV